MSDHSFALIAFNDSPYLSDCLESLKKQSIQSTIYISTSTPSEHINAIAKKNKVKVFVTQSGMGIAHDWNFALQQAKTKYVTLAHQDDLYRPMYTENCIQAVEKYKDTLMCFTGYTEIINGKNRSGTLLLQVKSFILLFLMPFKKNLRRKFWKHKLLSVGCPIPAPSVMYDCENLTDFQFSDEFLINIDWDAWYRMAKMKGRFIYVNQPLLKHRIHLDSATTQGLQNNARQNEDLKMFKRFWPIFIAKILAKIYAVSYNSNKN